MPENHNHDHSQAALTGVAGVHDLHVWEVTSNVPALWTHVLVREDSDRHELSHQLTRLLHDEFDIEHTTLQVEHEHTLLLSIESAEQRGRAVRPATP